MTIVTGASSNHFSPLRNLLQSIAFHEPSTHAVVYDLGLYENERAWLIANGWNIQRFDFENYPEHFQIKAHSGNLILRHVEAGAYAWKPVIVFRSLNEFGKVLWLDSGNLIHGSLDRIVGELDRCGIYTPKSEGTVGQWTMPETVARLGVRPDVVHAGSRNAAVVGFNASVGSVARLSERWARAAQDRECICPDGCSYFNHRFDQSILSILVEEWRQSTGSAIRDDLLGVSTHNDGLTSHEAAEQAGVSRPRMEWRTLLDR